MDLWAHQQREIDEHAFEPGWFQFWDPRTGKTRPAVIKIALWIARAGVRRVLVVAPKSACPVWLQADELGRFDPAHVRIIDLSDGLIPDRRAMIAALDDTLPTVLVINRSVLKALTGDSAHPGPLRKWAPQALVLDESHEYKTPSAQCSRAALALAKGARFRLGLTGTPDPESYEDFYGQFKIIAPNVFRFPDPKTGVLKNTTLASFEEHYIKRNVVYPDKIDGYTNVDDLRARIFSRASRVRQSDCFDMPAVRDIIVPVPLTRNARELYDELVQNTVADFFGIDIDATHQLSRLTILHQLAAGFVRNEGGVEWVHDGKITAALEYVETMLAAGKRLVLFHHYRAEGERLVGAIRKAFGREIVHALHGDTKGSDRSATPFLTWPKMQVFVAQEDTANLAISLREADHVGWTSWGPKSDVHYQARQRIFDDAHAKPGGLTYTYFEAPNTADAFMRATIKKKQTASEMLLDYGFERAALGRIA